MADPRVVISGLGAASPLGIGMDDTFAALLEGTSRVQSLQSFPPGKFPCTIAGEMENFSARKHVPKHYRKAVKVMARDIEIAIVSADLAFRDAGIETRGTGEEASIDSKRLGCNIGAGLICAELNELGRAVNTAVTDGVFDLKAWGSSGMNNLTPLWLLKYLPNMLSCHVTIIHGAEGPSNCITCGDASALLSAGESALYILRGAADVVVTGAAESKLNPMGMLRQGMLNRLCTQCNDTPTTAVRPFDAGHCGTVIGEGGAVAILERNDRAQQRGANIYAELVGYGASCDPQGIDLERPTAGNLQVALRRAMKSAGITPDDVDLLVTYGTGVEGEDLAEAKAWHGALGDAAGHIPAVALTGATGCLFAGGGAMQLAVAAKCLQQQVIPPTANFETPAEGCDLNLSSGVREQTIRTVLLGSFTVGGQSGACVLRRWEA